MRPQKACTTSGLGRAMGVARNTLLNYENPKHYTDEVPEDVRQEFMSTISDAKRRVEESAESQLFEGKATVQSSNLINNHGWVEKTVQEHEGGFFGQGGRLEVEIVNPEPTPDEPRHSLKMCPSDGPGLNRDRRPFRTLVSYSNPSLAGSAAPIRALPHSAHMHSARDWPRPSVPAPRD
jgi:DNA-packaging protein gp3